MSNTLLRRSVTVSESSELGVHRTHTQLLRQLQLEGLEAVEADGAAEADHRRLTHLAAVGQVNDAQANDLAGVGQHIVRHPRLGLAQCGVLVGDTAYEIR